MIEVSHISKSFNGKKALDDVSFSVGQCETVCIIGSMGSGKVHCCAVLLVWSFPSQEESVLMAV